MFYRSLLVCITEHLQRIRSATYRNALCPSRIEAGRDLGQLAKGVYTDRDRT